MLAFQVRLNRKKVATAGLPGAHVLSAVFTSVVRGESTRRSWAAGVPFRAKELTFSLGGMVTHPDGAHEHVDWAHLNLKAGDTVVLKVIDAKTVDAPSRRNRTGGPTIEESERRELKRLRKKYPSRGARSSNKPL